MYNERKISDGEKVYIVLCVVGIFAGLTQTILGGIYIRFTLLSLVPCVV
jgi:hypothetical protein